MTIALIMMLMLLTAVAIVTHVVAGVVFSYMAHLINMRMRTNVN